MVRHFCFWPFGQYWKKKLVADYEQLLRPSIFVFGGQNFSFYFVWKQHSFRNKKLHNNWYLIYFFFFCFFCLRKQNKIGLKSCKVRKFSNLNVLHKGHLEQIGLNAHARDICLCFGRYGSRALLSNIMMSYWLLVYIPHSYKSCLFDKGLLMQDWLFRLWVILNSRKSRCTKM